MNEVSFILRKVRYDDELEIKFSETVEFQVFP